MSHPPPHFGPQPTAMLTEGSGRPTPTEPEGVIKTSEIRTRMMRPDSGRTGPYSPVHITLMAHHDQGRVQPSTRMMRPDSGRPPTTLTRLTPQTKGYTYLSSF